MKKEIIKNEDGSVITVLIELKERKLSRDQKMSFTTRMVMTMLENDKIKVDKCIISDRIDNNNDLSRRNGKWVFSVLEESNRILAPTTITAEPTEDIYSDSLLEIKKTKKKKTKRRASKKKGN